MKVARWGNSLAVRLPAKVVEELNLREGDEVEVKTNDAADGPRLFSIERRPDRKAIVESLRKYRGIVPADFKFDRDEANER